eukprot:TRINITY_DN1329_c2_g1_i1.p1 TRINITY_DN1329_c2_g1~~TRINITY_DN1329_c2_g1_i1.p1  ORF type:complete len:656 (+),score=53.04 TRINITY_DN1329_c2_g1_i1:7143-9110(+)
MQLLFNIYTQRINMQKLINHLKTAKSLVKSSGRIKICLGNRSTDLDSCVGSVLLSFLLTMAQPTHEPPFIPVINGTLPKLQTRKALAYHFESCKIPLESLVFFDEISAMDKMKEGLLEVVLYDHNELDPTQEYLLPTIKQIYDHHIDLTKGMKASKVITFCGSATSLILHQPCVDLNVFDFDLSKFAIAPIIIDTKNLAAGLYKDRWNEIDEKAYKFLNTFLVSEGFDVEVYYKKLEKIDKDLEGNLAQGVRTLLEKDYKGYKGKNAGGKEFIFGASSIDIPLGKFVQHFERDALINEYKEFAKEKGLLFLVILGRAREKKQVRDFLVFSEDLTLLLKWTKLLEEKYAAMLGLEHLIDFSNTPECYYYTYKNLSFTRKKHEPLWRDISSQIQTNLQISQQAQIIISNCCFSLIFRSQYLTNGFISVITDLMRPKVSQKTASQKKRKRRHSEKQKRTYHNGVYDQEFEVEEILDSQTILGLPFYKIKWLGYPMSAATWEPLDNLKGIKDLVAEFNKKKANKVEDVTKDKHPDKDEFKGDINKDKPYKIENLEKIGTELYCTVSWKPRADGTIPGSTLYKAETIKELYPLILLEFEEAQEKKSFKLQAFLTDLINYYWIANIECIQGHAKDNNNIQYVHYKQSKYVLRQSSMINERV